MFGDRLFDFQAAAVKIAAHHLNKRNGVLIGDVVGLARHSWPPPSPASSRTTTGWRRSSFAPRISFHVGVVQVRLRTSWQSAVAG